MKIRVTKKFKYEGKIYEEGSVADFPRDTARNILDKGYGEKVEREYGEEEKDKGEEEPSIEETSGEKSASGFVSMLRTPFDKLLDFLNPVLRRLPIEGFDPSRYTLQLSILGVFLGMMAVFFIRAWGTFTNPIIYTMVMRYAPYYGLMTLAFTLIIVMGEIDLSFVSVFSFSSFAFVYTSILWGNVWLSLLVALASGALAGLLNGTLVTKAGVPSFVATLGGYFLWDGLANFLCNEWTGRSAISLPSGASSSFLGDLLSHEIAVPFIENLFIPMQFVWFIFFAVVFWLILNRHTFGNATRFIGDNEDSARMLGIRVDRVKILIFVMMGIMVAFAGVTNTIGATRMWMPNIAETYFLFVFAAVFVGGTDIAGARGTIFGTVVGVLIIQFLRKGVVLIGYGSYYRKPVIGIFLIIAITIQSLVRKKT